MGDSKKLNISRRGFMRAGMGLAASALLCLTMPKAVFALPASDEWFAADDPYVLGLLKKAEIYDSYTRYFCCVDTDLCRTTIFEWIDEKWHPIAGYNCFCGINQPWQSYEYGGYRFDQKLSWAGPRSRSFRGAYRIHGRFAEQGGSQFVTCYVECNHGYETDDCQRFEFTGYGNPNDYPFDQRFKTLGCAAQSYEVAQWIYETVPDGSTVLVFDECNPRPGWSDYGGNDASSGGTTADFYSYTVEHKSLIDGTVLATEELYGVVDAPTQAEPSSFEGYEVRDFKQEPIAEDGSTCIIIPYGVPASQNTPYRVEHRDVLAGTVFITETKSGVVGELTQAKAQELKGYEVRDIEQKPIAKDGSTVIVVKYDKMLEMFDIKESYSARKQAERASSHKAPQK